MPQGAGYSGKEKVEDGSQHYYDHVDSAGHSTYAHYLAGPKRVCGLKRTVFCIALAILILVIAIAIAAVLRGVLGTRSRDERHQSSSTSSSAPSSSTTAAASSMSTVQAKQNSGISLVVPASPAGNAAYYSYYQASSGAIIENTYANDTLQVTVNGIVLSSGDARNGTPIAATLWMHQDAVVRQIFYLDEDGNVMTTNTTSSSETWSEPYNILPPGCNPAAQGSVALTACSGRQFANDLDGIRVYYASPNGNGSNGYIQEVGADFSGSFSSGDIAQPAWNQWESFYSSDPNSGVACAVLNGVDHLKAIQQWQWNFLVADYATVWTMNAAGPSNTTNSSDILVANDGKTTDHIFFQTGDGRIDYAVYAGVGIDAVAMLETAAANTKLTAIYTNYTAMVMYQKASDAAMYYDKVTRDGQEVASGTAG
ncbi:hypothetical protein LTR85_007112 [Meristemomyces frigidus]|nr:hypothetical protein LTR85_007112 [Meristemomyces frigidus]